MPRIRMLGFSVLVSVLLVVVAMFSPAVSPASAFLDVPAGHAYAQAINELSSRGIISGYSTGQFGINDSASRQQFAKMIVKTLGLPVTGQESSPFTDVDIQTGSDPLYPSKYVAVCAKQGITTGKTPTTFDPFAHITREQLITMVTRPMQFLDPPSTYSPPFVEQQFTLKEHFENARKAAHAGLLDGLEGIGSAYDFQADATRGECVRLLYNLVPGDASTPPNPDVVASAQDTADALTALQPRSVPEHFMKGETVRREGDFDVNAYFQVLTHLSMEPGFVLDYVYDFEGLGGEPIIYARLETQPPYILYKHPVDTFGNPIPETGYRDTSRDFPTPIRRDAYLSHVRVDGTREGYVELALLRLLGNQFYLFWHAAYNDMVVVGNLEALEKQLAVVEAPYAESGRSASRPSPVWIRSQASRMDLRPTVHLNDNGTAEVRMVTFSKWRGLVEMRCTMNQSFPHQVSPWETRTLVAFNWGLMY